MPELSRSYSWRGQGTWLMEKADDGEKAISILFFTWTGIRNNFLYMFL